jgi:hypothetical protein
VSGKKNSKKISEDQVVVMMAREALITPFSSPGLNYKSMDTEKVPFQLEKVGTHAFFQESVSGADSG